MGFTFNDIHSRDMGIKARLTSWQVCGRMRNFTTTVPGKYGVADFGADFDYREITVHCNIYPQHSFTALVSALDSIADWLDPVQGPVQLVLDDVPDRYFMARLSDAVDCERLIRSSGSFDLKFFCPDPFGYAVDDEDFTISAAGNHTVTRLKGNIESNPVYRLKGILSSGANRSITITTNGAELKIANAVLSASETLVVDTEKMTAWIEDGNGNTVRNALPYINELNFPALRVGSNTVSVSVSNATFTELKVQAKSRWR